VVTGAGDGLVAGRSGAEAAYEVLGAWRSARAGGLGALLSDDEIEAYRARASAVGVGDTSYYAECRLGGERRLDFLVAFRREHFAAPEIAASISTRASSELPLAFAWQEASRFGRRWCTPGDDVHDLVSATWLEFDDVAGGDATFGPSLSACVVPGYPWSDAGSGSTRRECTDRVARVHRALCSDPTAWLEPSLRLCCDALPDDGRVIHLSRMNAREPRATKLYLAVPRRELVPYLRLVGWRGPLSVVDRLSSRIGRDLAGEAAYVDLNLDDARAPERATLGVAFSQQRAGDDPARRQLLGELVAERLATAEQAELLADWVAWRRSAPELPRLTRWLDLKVVFGAARDPVAKAYLGYRVDWSPFVVGY
jgi:hypothetical protein